MRHIKIEVTGKLFKELNTDKENLKLTWEEYVQYLYQLRARELK